MVAKNNNRLYTKCFFYKKEEYKRDNYQKKYSKNVLQDLNTKIIQIKPLLIKTLQMMKVFQKIKEKRENILVLQLLFNY